MSTLSKAFVVVNLLLGVAFLAVSSVNFAQQQDWRARHDENVKKGNDLLQAAESVNKQLHTIVTDRTEKIATLQAAIGNQNVAFEASQREIARLKADQATLSSNLRELTDSYKKMQLTDTARQDELKEVKAQLDRAQGALEIAEKGKTAAQDELLKLGEQNSDLKRQIDNLAHKIQEQTVQITSNERIIDAYLKAYPSLAQLKIKDGATVPPPIDAKVEDVDDNIGIVVLSVGAEQKVENGFTFYVYRDSDYIALVEVTKVHAQKSIATINQEMSKSRIQSGDSATTRIGAF
ncbi:MAG TPA: hypothetical protein VM141_06170 [Planctomycetota bacterium]|nr:hypothetical protein [Planctomycetota bacterium]